MWATFQSISTFINSTSLVVINPTLRLFHWDFFFFWTNGHIRLPHTLVRGCLGDSQQKVWHYTHRYEKIHLFVWRVLTLCERVNTAHWYHTHTKCWQSTLSFAVTVLHGLSDAPPPPLHTVMKYDLISVSAALGHTSLTSLSQILSLQFPFCLIPPHLLWLPPPFHSHLCCPRISY